jgi:transporter family-2 protein
MNATWIVPFIILGGALQTCGAAMNGQLYKYLINPWLASAISFALITIFFIAAFLIMPRPLPSAHDIAAMPWWAVIGGVTGQAAAGIQGRPSASMTRASKKCLPCFVAVDR